MKLVYVAGPFRALPDPANQWQQWQNITAAAALALEVWRLGAVAVCPHLNTAPFQGALPDDVWLAGDLAIVAKCDAVLMTPDWERSAGAKAEHAFARGLHLPIFYDLAALAGWLGGR